MDDDHVVGEVNFGGQAGRRKLVGAQQSLDLVHSLVKGFPRRDGGTSGMTGKYRRQTDRNPKQYATLTTKTPAADRSSDRFPPRLVGLVNCGGQTP